MKVRTIVAVCLLPLLLVRGDVVIVQQGTTTDPPTPTPVAAADDDASNGVDFRIVGGESAYAGEFPWFASSIEGSLCGASLVAPNVLLTAAHCARAFEVGQDVYVKAYRFQSSSSGAQRRTISATIPHPEYGKSGSNRFDYDFMLVQLERPIRNIDPIQLNNDVNVPVTDQDVTVMGFGTTSEGGSISRSLLFVDLKTTSQPDCQSVYGGSYDDDIMLCASEDEKDSCQGDSG